MLETPGTNSGGANAAAWYCRTRSRIWARRLSAGLLIDSESLRSLAASRPAEPSGSDATPPSASALAPASRAETSPDRGASARCWLEDASLDPVDTVPRQTPGVVGDQFHPGCARRSGESSAPGR